MNPITYLPIRLRTENGTPVYTMDKIMEALSNGTAVINSGENGSLFIEDLTNTNKIMGVVDSHNYIDNQVLILASRMLELASDTFSNHGCNDLEDDVSDDLYDESKMLKLIRKHIGEPEDCKWPSAVNSISDDMLMSVLADELKKIAGGKYA